MNYYTIDTTKININKTKKHPPPPPPKKKTQQGEKKPTSEVKSLRKS